MDPPTPNCNEALIRRLWDVFAAGHDDPGAAIDPFLGPDYVHRFDTDAQFTRSQYQQAVNVFYRAFPDLHYRIVDLVATGDEVVVRYEATGTHKADFFGFPATGRSVRYGGVYWYKIDGDVIAEDYEFWDGKKFHVQLGLPVPGLGS